MIKYCNILYNDYDHSCPTPHAIHIYKYITSNHPDKGIRELGLPALRGSIIFQLLDEKLSNGSETVTHTINVSALDA